MIALRRRPSLSALCFLACLYAGCDDGAPIGPPRIYYGQDVCAVCNMIISDDRYTAALVLAGNGGDRTRSFDDIGCLLDYEESQGDETVIARWVRGFRTHQWIEARAAVYLHSRELHSPMAFGLAACATEDEARGLLADFPGEILGFPEVRSGFEEGVARAAGRPDFFTQSGRSRR